MFHETTLSQFQTHLVARCVTGFVRLVLVGDAVEMFVELIIPTSFPVACGFYRRVSMCIDRCSTLLVSCWLTIKSTAAACEFSRSESLVVTFI